VVLALIPEDDVVVRSMVAAWDDAVPFAKTVGRMCDLSQHSNQYIYTAIGVPTNCLQDLFLPSSSNQDIIIRPTDRKGMTLSFRNNYGESLPGPPIAVSYPLFLIARHCLISPHLIMYRVGISRVLGAKKTCGNHHF
jgi:hypothetical protein